MMCGRVLSVDLSFSHLQISKPQMEKRRRERINHSLETLRLLLLENTDDEVKEGKIVKQTRFRCDFIANRGLS